MTPPFNRGRPRTEKPRRRWTVEVDEDLAAVVEAAARGAMPRPTIRSIIEEGMRLWLAQHGVSLPTSITTPKEPQP